MGDAAPRTGLTEQEYLAFERAAEERHEYADGEILAIPAGTFEHSLIASNINRELSTLLLERPCSSHGSDMRIHIPTTKRYLYADALVVCGQPIFTGDKRDNLTNPVVIIEVLSDSTESYDRGDKFEQYEMIPSLRDYVLVSQKKVRIEHFLRQEDTTWQRRIAGAGERVTLASIGCELEVDRAYLKVFGASAGSL
ncbi:MAG: Uma2 family endonuclease [Byssovorax sp.]